MELRKNGFLYKVAYGLRKNKPERSNLCRFFWRVLLSVILVWPPYGLFKAIDYGLIRFLLGTPIAFLGFGYCPLLQRKWLVGYGGGHKLPFRPISWWPKLKNGEHIMPFVGLLIIAVIPACIAGTVWCFYKAGVFVWHNPWVTLLGTPTFAVILLLNLLNWWLTWYTRRSKKSNGGVVSAVVKREGRDVVGLFAAYIKAKKDKVCPTVQFTEKPAIS